MSNLPEKIWLGCADADNEHQVWADPDEGGTEYTRSDLATPNPDAIWNEAIEAAASTADKRATISDDVFAAKGYGRAVNYIADAHRASAAAIRTLKRQQGGNEA